MFMQNHDAGFTFIELLVVMTFMAILFGLVSINLTGLIPKASLVSSSDTLLSDLKHQQIKSMLGDTQGTTTSLAQGIFFTANSYTLFAGDHYDAADELNVVISLEKTQITDVTISNATLIFEQGSGEVRNLTNGTYSLTVRDTVTGKEKNISLNRYGAVTIN